MILKDSILTVAAQASRYADVARGPRMDKDHLKRVLTERMATGPGQPWFEFMVDPIDQFVPPDFTLSQIFFTQRKVPRSRVKRRRKLFKTSPQMSSKLWAMPYIEHNVVRSTRTQSH